MSPPMSPPDNTTHRAAGTRRDLGAITADGVCFSIMVGAGETYVPAFALAMGLGETGAGWIVTVPMLTGAIIQLVSPAAIARLGSLRAWVVICAVVQALTMLAYGAIALAGHATPAMLFLVATIYWAAGLATGPAWNTWVGALVPRRIRARFFARRSRFAHLAVLVGLVGAGLALEFGRSRGDVLSVFAVIFIIAGAARVISSILLASQHEPRDIVAATQRVPIRAWIRRWRGSNDGRLLLYMLAVQGGVQVAGPFFTPYMLGEMKLDYMSYLLLIGTSFLTKMLVLPSVGTLVHRLGARPMLIASGAGIIPLSALWVISDSVPFLLVTQIISGFIWAAYELTTFLLLFDHIRESERTSVLTSYNLAHASMTVCGALIGGTILHLMAEGHAAYMVIFALSGVLRLAALPIVLGIRPLPVEHYAIATRPLGVRPNAGSFDAPIVSSLGGPHEDDAAPDEESPADLQPAS